MSKEKIEMTEKQFEELCKAVYPHLKAIQEALKGNGEEMSASISVGSDGYLNFHPYNSDWELSKFKDSQATMKYEQKKSCFSNLIGRRTGRRKYFHDIGG